MLSHCMIPKWNLRQQRQEEDEGEGNRPFHVQGQLLHNHSSTPLVPMSNWRLAEAMHGLGVGDTLDSTVNQATWHSRIPNLALQAQQTQAPPGMSSTGKWGTTSEVVCSTSSSSLTKKRARPESDQQTENSTCFHSSALSFKTRITEEDSACHGGSENLEDEGETKGEIIGRSHSKRRGRAAAIRRRRDRINQRMKALQKLVPNASKADKVSMLDEVIEYLKQLQAQVKMMSARNMSQMTTTMMMPHLLQMQQLHLQMSLLARMRMRIGIGIGLGMLNMSTVARFASRPPLVCRPSISAHATTAPAPPAIPNHGEPRKALDATINNSTPFMNPYCSFLPQQSVNNDPCNKMRAIYWRPINQTAGSTLLPWSHVQGG